MSRSRPHAHRRAVALALFVTFLWSTSWILIKFGLDELPPLTFAGLRYALGAICLLPYALRFRRAAPLLPLGPRDWLVLGSFGVLFYAITQGAQFMALSHLPAAGLSLLLNLSPVLTAVLAAVMLGERPTAKLILALMVCLAGVLLYFGPGLLLEAPGPGVMFGLVCLLANSSSMIIGRAILRSERYPVALTTVISMGAGALVLLTAGVLIEPWPRLSPGSLLLIGWLGVVNTALAFLLWNIALTELNATEAGLINNAMLPQIAILSWVILGESLDGQAMLAIGLVLAAVLSVHRDSGR